MPDLSHQGDRLEPAEALFNSLALPLADLIAAMPRRALVDRTAAAPLHVLRHVRRHVQMPALADEVPGVVRLVSSYGDAMWAGNLLQQDQRRVALRRAVGLKQLCVHDQSVPVLGQ